MSFGWFCPAGDRRDRLADCPLASTGDRTGTRMAQRVVFHIGLMKSGTTFIQGRLNTNRERLADAAGPLPGPHLEPPRARRLRPARSEKRKPGSWNSLVDEINEYDGTAVVSMEYLAPMGRPRIKVLRDAFPDTDVRVAVTRPRPRTRCPGHVAGGDQEPAYLDVGGVRPLDREGRRPRSPLLASAACRQDRAPLGLGDRGRPRLRRHRPRAGAPSRDCSGTGSARSPASGRTPGTRRRGPTSPSGAPRRW